MGKKFLFSIFIFILFLNLNIFAEKISSIDIKGNKNISAQTIFSKIKTKKGQEYLPEAISEDIKRLYATGYFEDVKVERKTTPEGIEVIFIVKEKPTIEKIEFKNLRHIHKKKVLSSIQIKEGKILDIQELKEDVQTIENMLKKKGYTDCRVEYTLDKDVENNTVKITFIVNEGKRIRIKKVYIEGNKTFPDKRILKLMKTRPPFLWMGGYFNKDTMEEDIEKIKDFYKRQGFSEVKVNYFTKLKDRFLYITVYIEEGKRYYVGKINIEGNENITLEDIKKVIKTKPDSIYIEPQVKEDVVRIQELYVNRGYVFASIRDIEVLNPQTQKIDITFKIKENQVAYINMIKIKGNTKTRDDVIRRELRLYPGDKFNGEKLRRSRERLQNLGIFEEVKFDSEKVAEDKVNLIVEVKEAKTGSISFGGGYSSIDEFIGFIEFTQRNFDWSNPPSFVGGAQTLKIAGEFGTVRDFYELSFWNPWIFNKPVSFGFDAYRRTHIREEDIGYAFDEKRTGGDVKFGYEFTEYIKGLIGYRFENINISDVVSEASDELKKEEGKQNLAKLEYSLIWDSRDNIFSPSRGVYARLDVDQADSGIGSDKNFVKLFFDNSIYFPLPLSSVIELRSRIGVVNPYGSSDYVPIFERFFAGGAYTIRGYHERKVGPIDPKTKDPIGGESLMVFNVEYTYPLTDFLKVALFFDTGNVWKDSSDLGSGDFKSSVGAGIRVKTPLGPIKLDYGWPLDIEPGETGKEGRFHFSISRGF